MLGNRETNRRSRWRLPSWPTRYRRTNSLMYSSRPVSSCVETACTAHSSKPMGTQPTQHWLKVDQPRRCSCSTLPSTAAEKLGDPGTRGYLSGNLGLTYLFLGDVSQAREQFTQEVWLSVGQAFQFGAEEGLAGLAAIAATERLYERAATLLGAALALGRWDRVDRPILDRLERDYFAPARAHLGATTWRQAQEQGAAMSYEEAIEYATRHPMLPDRSPAGHADA